MNNVRRRKASFGKKMAGRFQNNHYTLKLLQPSVRFFREHPGYVQYIPRFNSIFIEEIRGS